MSNRKELACVLPVSQMPYLEDETADEAALGREPDWLLANGTDGMLIAMVKEVLRLSHDDRKSLAAAVCRLVNGRGTVTISVGAESTRVAEELARHQPVSVATGDTAVRGPVGYVLNGQTRAEIDRLFEQLERVVAAEGSR